MIRRFLSGAHLRAGDWVEVRGEQEILATLDEGGALDSLPFMPEMLQYCGQRLRVEKRADKTCDTVTKTGGRRMYGVVHLDTRCDGSAHGGCQASCLIFWKEAWLRRVSASERTHARPGVRDGGASGCTLVQLEAATRRGAALLEPDVRYRCQATDLVQATSPMRWWDVRQYWRDWWYENVPLLRMLRSFAIAGFNMIQRRRGGNEWPRIKSPAPALTRTPLERLDLQPGELVQIKSGPEIMATLDTSYKNRGMRFDLSEMAAVCGTQHRVLKRVERIIDEQTGQMMHLPNECIILDGVVCTGELSRLRLFCPRAIYPYWREIWLRRVEEAGQLPAGTPHEAISGRVPQ